MVIWLFSVTSAIQATDYVIISEVMYDTPLNEQIAQGVPYCNGEYIELYNPGLQAVNLTNWKLKGGGSTEIYQFPDNTILDAGGYLIVAYRHIDTDFILDSLYENFTSQNERQIYYQRKIILSNSGEALKLINAAGLTRDSVYVDGTINLRKPDRLSAPNADGTPGINCVSLQRKTAVFDADGNAITNNQEWIASGVNPYSLFAQFTFPEIAPIFTEIPTALSMGNNYIVTVTPLDATREVSINESRINIADEAEALISIQYFDGLGRPVQAIQKGITPERNDLVRLTEYDGVGREEYQWLPSPVAVNNGAFVTPDNYKSNAQSAYADSRPYAQIVYESSPFNRITHQKGAGDAWVNKSVETVYGTNTGGEVMYFHANENTLIRSGHYDNGTLYKKMTQDEDNKSITEYTDKLGRVVMTRRGTDADTYYVYNDLGQLVYVLPPLFADNMGGTSVFDDNSEPLKQYGYVYRYDSRGNCIKKRLPGCAFIFMIYDKADRLVLSQDGNQRSKNHWTTTKYDVFGRIIAIGVLMEGVPEEQENSSLKSLVNEYKNQLIVETYSGSSYSNTHFAGAVPLTVNYYDNYSFISDSKLNYQEKQGYSARYNPSGGLGAKGLLTGSKVYELNYPDRFNITVNYYNDKGNVVQTRSTNHLGGYDYVYNKVSFTGKPIKTENYHSVATSYVPGYDDVGATERSALYEYEYDHGGRLKETKLNGVSYTKLNYNELGQLENKIVYNGLDNIHHAYNVRGWLKSIDGNYFKEQLFYESSCGGSIPSFNGNTRLY